MEYIILSSIALMGIIPFVVGKILVGSKGLYTINWPNSNKWNLELKIKINKYFYISSFITMVACCLGVISGIILKAMNLVSFYMAILIGTYVSIISIVLWIAIFISGLLKILKVAQQGDAPERFAPSDR